MKVLVCVLLLVVSVSCDWKLPRTQPGVGRSLSPNMKDAFVKDLHDYYNFVLGLVFDSPIGMLCKNLSPEHHATETEQHATETEHHATETEHKPIPTPTEYARLIRG